MIEESAFIFVSSGADFVNPHASAGGGDNHGTFPHLHIPHTQTKQRFSA